MVVGQRKRSVQRGTRSRVRREPVGRVVTLADVEELTLEVHELVRGHLEQAGVVADGCPSSVLVRRECVYS